MSDSLLAFHEEKAELNEHKVWMMKQLNSVNADIVLIKRRLKLATKQSEHLAFQDDIMSHRAKMSSWQLYSICAVSQQCIGYLFCICCA